MKNIIFYPRNILGNKLANAFGTRVMLQTLDELKQYAKNRGFTELRVQYQRASNSSAAVPGSILDKIFKL